MSNFNPRSPHGERPHAVYLPKKGIGISIHAPRTGSDVGADPGRDGQHRISIHAPRTGSDLLRLQKNARSTISIHAPRTGSDVVRPHWRFQHDISIHAPRTGSDCFWRNGGRRRGDFNPRSPHGERLAGVTTPSSPLPFQSTLPARGATPPKPRRCARTDISIHAPRTGSDFIRRLTADVFR